MQNRQIASEVNWPKIQFNQQYMLSTMMEHSIAICLYFIYIYILRLRHLIGNTNPLIFLNMEILMSVNPLCNICRVILFVYTSILHWLLLIWFNWIRCNFFFIWPANPESKSYISELAYKLFDGGGVYCCCYAYVSDLFSIQFLPVFIISNNLAWN